MCGHLLVLKPTDCWWPDHEFSAASAQQATAAACCYTRGVTWRGVEALGSLKRLQRLRVARQWEVGGARGSSSDASLNGCICQQFTAQAQGPASHPRSMGADQATDCLPAPQPNAR